MVHGRALLFLPKHAWPDRGRQHGDLVSPLFVWDLVRERRVHRAFVIWFALGAPMTIAVHLLWGTPLWRGFAARLLGAQG